MEFRCPAWSTVKMSAANLGSPRGPCAPCRSSPPAATAPTAVLGSGPLVAASCSQQVLATCGHCPCGSPWILPTCRCILQPAATLYCGPCHLASARQCSSSPVFRCSPLLHIIFSTTYLQDSTSAPPGVWAAKALTLQPWPSSDHLGN